MVKSLPNCQAEKSFCKFARWPKRSATKRSRSFLTKTNAHSTSHHLDFGLGCYMKQRFSNSRSSIIHNLAPRAQISLKTSLKRSEGQNRIQRNTKVGTLQHKITDTFLHLKVAIVEKFSATLYFNMKKHQPRLKGFAPGGFFLWGTPEGKQLNKRKWSHFLKQNQESSSPTFTH